MSEKSNVWLMVVIAGLLGVIVGMMVNGREVVAQGDGAAAHIVALVGDVTGSEQPIYVIDTREQTLLVYEYGLGRSGLSLVATRSMEYDKLMPEFDIRTTGGRSPNVEDVRKIAGKRGKRRR